MEGSTREGISDQGASEQIHARTEPCWTNGGLGAGRGRDGAWRLRTLQSVRAHGGGRRGCGCRRSGSPRPTEKQARGGWFRAGEGSMASSTRPLAAALVSHPEMHACGGRGRARAQGGARWGRGGGAARFTGAGFVSLQRRFFPGRETGSHA